MKKTQVIQRHPLLLLGLIVMVLPSQAAIIKDTVHFTSVRVEMAVDLDRDWEIGFDEYDSSGRLLDNFDRTRPERPFRFWINNNFDVVNYKGDFREDRKKCGNLFEEGGHQVCEQEDFLGSSDTNANIPGIESVRDLEDFSALAIKITPWGEGFKDVKVRLRASGFGMGVFKGVWQGNFVHGYLKDGVLAERQALMEQALDIDDSSNTTGNPAAERAASEWLDLDFIDNDGVARLIFEGKSHNRTLCQNNPENCFLEVVVEDNNNNVLVADKLYIQLNDLTDYFDHYTLGDYTHGPGTPVGIPTNLIVPDPPSVVHAAEVSLFDDQTNDYILHVHGWRMPPDERRAFAATAFKRLYWSGYRGKFGFISWPTAWFDKPAWVYDPGESLRAVLRDLQNYNRSEAIARRTGWLIRGLINTIASDHNLYLTGHSMGNVVIAEALREYNGASIAAYAALQPADSSGAYNSVMPYNGVNLAGLGERDFSFVWDILHGGSVDEGSFPTDRYVYAQLPVEPQNVREFYRGFFGIGGVADTAFHAYYEGIGQVVNIINFYNPEDSALALDVWKTNQVLKPNSNLVTAGNIGLPPQDWLPPHWRFERVGKFDGPEGLPCFSITSQQCNYFNDKYYYDEGPLSFEVQLLYEGANLNERSRPDIIAHINPSPYDALGRVSATGLASEIGSAVDMNDRFGFTGSNYDHSAEFLSDFPTRRCFWGSLLFRFGLVPGSAVPNCSI